MRNSSLRKTALLSLLLVLTACGQDDPEKRTAELKEKLAGKESKIEEMQNEILRFGWRTDP